MAGVNLPGESGQLGVRDDGWMTEIHLYSFTPVCYLTEC